ncbi:hypothetical protein DFH06DRAFT_570581 [Mycena polygramma]|nr:hypothetical protein DFH06DRAFT_570581 [Mycena polygramma]
MNTPTFLFRPFARLAIFITFIQISLSVGTVFQRTIDDTLGDSESGELPMYTPASGFSPNSDCAGCVLHPDPASAFKGTWHDGSQLPGGPAVSVTLSFSGTGISVFCILANLVGDSTSNLAVTLDGAAQKPFSYTPDNTSDFVYNAPVFSVDGLDRVQHTVVIVTDNPKGSLFLFDYANYTAIADSTMVFQLGHRWSTPSPVPRYLQ